VPVRQVEDSIEGVAVAVGVVVFGVGTRPAGLDGFLDGGEVGESQLVVADGVARERPPRRPGHELGSFEDEEGSEVVGGDPAQPDESATEEVLDVVVLRHDPCKLADVSGEVELGIGRHCPSLPRATDISVRLGSDISVLPTRISLPVVGCPSKRLILTNHASGMRSALRSGGPQVAGRFHGRFKSC
jgi:hypothetical protein